MDQPLLTIGIPTYNRAAFLAECLESLKAAVGQSGFAEQIEIIVSDNASTDNTTELAAKFQSQIPNFRYSRNQKNLEFDGNVFKILELCRGRWCWLMSDDEVVSPGALKFLRPLLENRPEVSYICINHGGLPQAKEVEFYQNGSEWIKHLELAGGLLSQNIFRMSSMPSGMEKYWGNFWPHFSIALEIMGKRGALLVKKLFIEPQPPRKSRFFKPAQVFYNYVSLFNIVKNLPNLGYQTSVIAMALNKMAKGLPRVMVTAKLLGAKPSFSDIKLLLTTYAGYPVSAALALLVYLAPTFVWKFFKRIKNRS